MEKKLRYCVWCAKKIPNYRQARCKTCSLKCSSDHNWGTLKERARRKKIAEEKYEK